MTTTTTSPTQRMRDRAGQGDPTALPFGCRCGARWSGSRTAHCAADCHETFSGVTGFDQHRSGGKCTPPAELGMSLLDGRAFPCWGYPTEPGAAA